MPNKKQSILMIYPATEKFSGQTAATIEILKVFSDSEKWHLVPLTFPSWKRKGKNPIYNIVSFIFRLFSFWGKLFKYIFIKDAIIYINHTQSMASFIRMGIPHLLISKLNKSAKFIVSLHGHIFMTWEKGTFKHNFFKALMKNSSLITVLGNKQKDKLTADYKIDSKKVQIVNNPCEFNLIPKDENHKIHSLTNGQAIKTLHLSLLIESKGFVKYLETLEAISRSENTKKIEAVLCGPLCFTKFCTKFENEPSAERWIHDKVAEINKSEFVSAQWIPGAFGKEKEKLFKEAHIFMFPSQYPVEAQPLVLIEAMSAGCALITTTAGEIAEEVQGSQAIIVEDVTVQNLKTQLLSLIRNDEKRLEMSKSSISRASEFGLDVYKEVWGKIFSEICK